METPSNEPNFGLLPIIASSNRTGNKYAKISELNPSLEKSSVTIRARLTTCRTKGNILFLILRQKFFTVQAIISKSNEASDPMLKFAESITKESIVDITGYIVKCDVISTTQKDVEIHVKSLFVVSMAEQLPIQVADCEIAQPLLDAQTKTMQVINEKIEIEKAKLETATNEKDKRKINIVIERLVKEKSTNCKYATVSQKERLDNRIIDLRTTTNQAIFRIQAGVCSMFRDYLNNCGFTEIHTPKLIGAASEGGSDVFKVQYFDQNAYLAQSPQLYKQMTICGDMDRVFEIGHVFRAENSMTHRHLTEYIGLDIEMTINEHYHEILDVLDAMFISIFDTLETKYKPEIDVVRKQFPSKTFEYTRPSVRLHFNEAVELLRQDQIPVDDLQDLSTVQERRLGELVKAKYHTDFFILDKFPSNARPFYAMDDPIDPNYTNSYDFFIRGQEVLSGGQRIHDYELLKKKAIEKGIQLNSIQSYIDAFKYGVAPHGGGGIGLERVVMLYIGLDNIRKTSMFPRDPSRLNP